MIKFVNIKVFLCLVKVIRFEITSRSDCFRDNDNFEIYDGKNTTASLLRRISGCFLPHGLFSTQRDMLVVFNYMRTYTLYSVTFEYAETPGN